MTWQKKYNSIAYALQLQLFALCHFSIGPIGFTNQTGEETMKFSSISCDGLMKYTMSNQWNKIIVRQTALKLGHRYNSLRPSDAYMRR